MVQKSFIRYFGLIVIIAVMFSMIACSETENQPEDTTQQVTTTKQETTTTKQETTTTQTRQRLKTMYLKIA